MEKLSAALDRALNDPKLKARLESDGTEPYFLPPAEFTTFLRKEVSETGKLIDALGIPKQ